MRKPAIKKAWTIFHRPDGKSLCFLECFDTYFLIKLNNPEVAQHLFPLINGENTPEEIANKLSETFPGITTQNVNKILDKLNAKNLLEEHELSIPDELDENDLQRYHRQIAYFADFERQGVTRFDMQANLKRSKVVVLGLGGVGSWAVTALAAAGVGEIVGVDYDVVEDHNLHRQILYKTQDIGFKKVEAAQSTIQSLNPLIKYRPVYQNIDSPEAVEELISGANMVVCLVDEPLIIVRRWVSEACNKLNIPMMIAGGMEVGPIFVPGETPSFFDLEEMLRREVPYYDNLIKQYAESPVDWVPAMGTVSAIVGSYVAYEVVKYVSKYAVPATVGHMLRINAFTLSSEMVPVPQLVEISV